VVPFCGKLAAADKGLVRYSEALTALVKSQLPWRITRLREQHGLTQAGLAKRTGLAPATLSKLERGVFNGLYFDTIVKLAATFEVSLDYMAGIDHAQVVRAMTVVGRACPECGRGEAHPFGECMIEMQERGRSVEFIAARFGVTVQSARFTIQEEYRVRRERTVRNPSK
jgi:transcriptional regulator with XRE-family HTH domain